MKKWIALLLALILVLGILGGCSQTTSDKTSQDTTASATQQPSDAAASEASDEDLAGTQLVVMSSQNWVNDTDQALAEKFKEETSIEVDIQAVPDDQYQSIVMSKLASGEGPDIFYATCGAGMSNYMPDKYMLDLSEEEWTSRYKDWAKAAVSNGDKLVGLNRWSVNGWLIMYNKNIFAQYNLSEPANFEEFKAVCQTLLDNGIRPIFQNSADSWHDFTWLNALNAALVEDDPDIYTKLNNNEVKLADYPHMVQALNEINELAQLGYFGDTYLSDSWSDAYDSMGSGESAMILAYTAYEFEIESMYPDCTADTWGGFVVPLCDNTAFTVSAGGQFSAINKDSKNIAAAKKYFSWLAEQEQLQVYYDGHAEQNMTSFEGVDVAKKSAILEEFEQSVPFVADFQGGIKYYSENEISKYMQEMYLGSKTAEEVLQAIDEYRQQMFDLES